MQILKRSKLFARFFERAPIATIRKEKRAALIAAFGWLAATLAILVPRPASALFGLGSIVIGAVYSAVANGMFVVAFVLSLLGGMVIAIQAWVLQLMLTINFHIVNSLIVKIGFPVTLSLANLGLVFGLIFIAIATIVRLAGYGMKQTLWKLIASAILINFGLVIGGTILSFSDSLSLFFLKAIDPLGSLDTSISFATNLSAAFNPQALIAQKWDTSSPQTIAELKRVFGDGTAGKNVGKIIPVILSVFFVVASLVVIIIFFTFLNVMLFLRYLNLGLLFLTLPLAWGSWPFPGLSKHNAEWWSKFLKRAFFTPVSLFFLWLGLKISEQMAVAGNEFDFAKYKSDITGPLGSFINSIGSTLAAPVEQFVQMAMLVGIFMGGMFAAQKFGIEFADSSLKAAKSAGNWAKGKATSYAARGARAGIQKSGLGGVADRLAASRFAAIAGLGRGAKDLIQKGGGDLVADAQKKIHHGDIDSISVAVKGGMELPELLAHLNKAGDDLSKITDIGGKSLAEWFAANHDKLEQYGQHGLEKQFAKMGLTHGLAGALKLGSENAPIDPAALRAAAAEAMQKGDPATLAALMKNGALGIEEPEKLRALRKAMVAGFGKSFSPKQFANFVSKMGREQVSNLQDAMRDAIGNDPAAARQMLGNDLVEYFRGNGGIRNMGIRSELWGEDGHSKQDEADLSDNEEAKKAPEPEPEEKHEESHPEPHPTPQPDTGGGGGNDKGDHGHAH